MWIEEIFVNEFGAWRQLGLSGLRPGLNLIVGPNEAGKTTILEFLRSVFVGFRKRTARVNSYEPENGATRQGWVHVRTSTGERLRFERIEKPGCKNGMLTILDEAGCRLEGSAVYSLEEGFDTGVFDTLFAFDLDRMRQLDQNALRAKIVATALGSFETNPLDVIKSVEERLKLLNRRSAGNGKSLAALNARIRDVDRRLTDLAALPTRYDALKKQSETVGSRLCEIERLVEDGEEVLHRLNEILRCEQPWKNLLALDAEMAAFADAGRFPADGLVRLEKALERQGEIQDQLIETQKALEQLSAKLETLAPDQKTAAHLHAIQTLSRHAGSMADLPRVIHQKKEEVARAISNLEEQLSAIGVDWQRQTLIQWAPSAARDDEIRTLSQSCLACGDRIRDIGARLEETSEQISIRSERIAAVRKELESLERQSRGRLDAASRRMLQVWIEAQQTVSHLAERLSDQNEGLRKLLQERKDLLVRMEKLESVGHAAPFSTLFRLLISVLAVGGSGLLFVSPRTQEGALYLVAGIGLCILGSSIGLAVWRYRSARIGRLQISEQKEILIQALNRCRAEITRHESQRRSFIARIASSRSKAQQMAQQVLGDPHAGPEAILEAQRRSDAAEEPSRRRRVLEESLRTDLYQAEAEGKHRGQLAGKLHEARAEFAASRQLMVKRLSEMGLSLEWQPGSLPALIDRVNELSHEARRVAAEEERLAAMSGEWTTFGKRVRALTQELGRPLPDGKSPLEEADEWVHLANETRDLMSRRAVALEQINEQQCRLAALSRKMDEAQARIDELFQAVGAPDEEAFREQGRRSEYFRDLTRKGRVILEGLFTESGCNDEADLRNRLADCDWEQLKQDRSLLQAARDALRQEAQELAGREGRLQQEIETLESAEETERLLAEKESLLAQLDEAVREWTHLRLASALLERTLRMYESDKQPKVLERSSELFRMITGGAFSRILFSLSEDSIKAERPDGARLDEGILSRGTLEQVYLAVRLAYLEVYHPKDLPFPLLMDDILVNFDVERARNAANALVQFSQKMGLQVFFFTCHRHVADLFPPNVVEVRLGPARADIDTACSEIAAGAAWVR